MIADRTAVLEAFCAEQFGDRRDHPPPRASSSTFDDDEILRLAREAVNGSKFMRLWAGDTSGHDGDDSAADLALCSLLAFWTQDVDQLDRLFRRSGLYREKWERADYRMRTINKALSRTEVYEPPAAAEIRSPGRNGASAHADGASGAGSPNGGTGPPSAHDDEPIIAGVRCSDIGNAEQLAARINGQFRSVPASKRWLVYDGGRWQPDTHGRIVQEAQRTIIGLYANLACVEDAKERKHLRDHIQRSESQRAIQAAVTLAMSDPRLTCAEGDFDAKPGLLNVKNGTIELNTGTFRDHDPADLLTKQAPVAFDPDATAPRWERFLREIMPDEAQRGWLQRYMGYVALGDPVEQVIAMAYGGGQNGKSTTIDVICGVMGSYALQADVETFLQQRHTAGGSGATPDLARLPGVRFVFAAEPGAGRRLNVSRLKSMSGGEHIVARPLYGAPFEFDPQFSVWISTNKKPVVPGDDSGLWRRLRLIPFTVKVPEEQRVFRLSDEILAEEASGVLNWILTGLRLWRVEGRLPSVESIRQATNDYREEHDEVGQFLAHRCRVGEGLRTPATELYQAFSRWLTQEFGSKPPSQTMFGRSLHELGFDSYRDGLTYRLGLELLPDNNTPITSRGGIS